MPLTTYTAGEVLTAASLNNNFTVAAAEGGLELISATTIGTTVSSVTVSGAFSADYDRYLLTIAGGVGSASAGVNLTLGATTSNYRFAANYASNSAATGGVFSSAGATSSWQECCYMSTAGISFNMTLINPFLTTRTLAHWQIHGPAASTVNLTVNGGGFLDDATSYTAFTLTTVSGTMTGGTIRVYGYKN